MPAPAAGDRGWPGRDCPLLADLALGGNGKLQADVGAAVPADRLADLSRVPGVQRGVRGDLLAGEAGGPPVADGGQYVGALVGARVARVEAGDRRISAKGVGAASVPVRYAA